MRLLFVFVYLAAIVAANLVTTHFAGQGHPEASVYTAASLVALTFVLRDRLHDAWSSHRVVKMAALIASGALLSYLLNADAGPIAVASVVAFAASESVDALTYHAARRRPWLERSNVSNVFGALVDSAVFVAIAFPGFLFGVAFGQATAKVAGGLICSLLLARKARA